MTTNTETKVAVELTKEELAVVEANRKADAERKEEKRVEDERKEKVDFARADGALKARQAFEASVEKKFADIGWDAEPMKAESLKFKFDGGVHIVPQTCTRWTNPKYEGVKVIVGEHRVYGRWSIHGTSKGYKLFVSGPYALVEGMESRAYANPKSIDKALAIKVDGIRYQAELKAERVKAAETKESFLSEALGIKVEAKKEWRPSFSRRERNYEVQFYEAGVAGHIIRVDVAGLVNEAGVKSDPRDYMVGGIGFLTLKAATEIIQTIKNCPVNGKGNR